MLARILFLTAALLLAATTALAQPVTVIGPVTPGNLPAFNSPTVIKDSGSSAVSLPVSAKGNGAVGDGTTDDTAHLQTWITNCQNGSRYCFLDPTPGTCYKITAAINVTAAITVFGAGREVSVICPANATQNTFAVNTTQNHGGFYDFAIQPLVTKTGGSGISITAPSSFNGFWRFERLLMSMEFNGITAIQSAQTTIDDVVIVCSNKCLNGAGTSPDVAFGDGSITNAYVQPLGGSAVGIYLGNVGGVKIVNSKVLGSGLYGIQWDGAAFCTTCSDIFISNSSIEGVQKGFVFSGGAVSLANVTLTGNEITGTTAGIEVAGTGLNSFVVTGNVIAAFSVGGIVVDLGSALSDLAITGNVIVGGGVGISISSDTLKCMIGSNQIDVATPITDSSGACVQSATRIAALTNNALIVGKGASGIGALASLGTTTTVLHGNAAGLPTFGAVAAADLAAGVFANPAGTVGLSAINGVAGTAMRSDAAPPLSQSIAPTWTGIHTFNAAQTVFNPATGIAGLSVNGPSGQTLTLDLFAAAAQSAFVRMGPPSTVLEFQTDGGGNWLLNTAGISSAVFKLNRAGSLTNTLILDQGHLGNSAATPTPSSCGTSPSIVGSDVAGTVTMGTGNPTTCTITFAHAYATTPNCTVTWQATPLASQSYIVSTAAIALTQTATSSNKVSYHCWANSTWLLKRDLDPAANDNFPAFMKPAA